MKYQPWAVLFSPLCSICDGVKVSKQASNEVVLELDQSAVTIRPKRKFEEGSAAAGV